MWLLIYLLIFLLPVLLIILIFMAIGVAGMQVFKNGKQSFHDLKPYTGSLSAGARNAQQKGLNFGERGQKLASSFEEVGGRWSFITETLAGTTKSPVVTLAGVAGRIAASRADGE